MKKIINLLFLLLPFSLAADDFTFIVPDSVIAKSSFEQVNLDDRLIAFPLRQDDQPGDTVVHFDEENIYNRPNQLNQFGLNRAIRNIGRGSILVFPVKSENPAPAVIIFPGGAFVKITIDKEGIDIAQRLNRSGITAIVVKYRTVPVEAQQNWSYRASSSMYDAFYSDARRAMHLICSKRYEFNIDPNRIGIMGFSAGGRLAANLLVDQKSNYYSDCKINFGCLIYPVITDSLIQQINQNTPQTFLVNCYDDKSAPQYDTENFYNALITNGVESEAHFFETGGHGFGLGVNGGDVTRWSNLFINWLNKIGFFNFYEKNVPRIKD